MPADERARKMALYEQLARVGKALANPARLELLDLLAQGERSVEELAETAGMKVSNTSAQLRALAGAGLVASRRDGVRIYYRLADENVSAFVGQVQDFAASRLAEVEQANQWRGMSCSGGWTTGRSWCWTCGPRRSTRPGISPGRSACRTTSSPPGSPSSPKVQTSLPTAAAGTAYSLPTRCVCCGHAASPPGRCKEVCPTGGSPGCPSLPEQARDLPAWCHLTGYAYLGSIRAATRPTHCTPAPPHSLPAPLLSGSATPDQDVHGTFESWP